MINDIPDGTRLAFNMGTVGKCSSHEDYISAGISMSKQFSEHCLETGIPTVGWSLTSDGEFRCIGVHKTAHIGESKNKVKMMAKGFMARSRLASIYEARKNKTK